MHTKWLLDHAWRSIYISLTAPYAVVVAGDVGSSINVVYLARGTVRHHLPEIAEAEATRTLKQMAHLGNFPSSINGEAQLGLEEWVRQTEDKGGKVPCFGKIMCSSYD
ncbi:hypothetical protein MHYP_G00003080 [Metynnis hypsauchen]